MSRYSHADVLDNGLAYIKANCNKAILMTAYTTVYATANGANKVAEAVLATGDFALSGADGAARTLTCTMVGKSGGTAQQAVADGTNMHVAFVDTVNSKVLHVTEESSDQAIVLGNPVQFNANHVFSSGQPTA